MLCYHSYISFKAADELEPEHSVSEAVVPYHEVLVEDAEVAVASCSQALVPMVEENMDGDEDEDENDIFSEVERHQITLLEFQGVPRELAVVRTVYWDVSLNFLEENLLLGLLSQGSTYTSALRSVFKMR